MIICKTCNLIEYAQGIPHATFAFLGNDLQGGLLGADLFLITYFLQMGNRIMDRNPFKIENLATA